VVELAAREALLQDVADGRVALSDVGGLSSDDVFAIARVGAAAMQGGRFAQAASVFRALQALQPRVTVHGLHLALALQGDADIDGAIAAISDVLGRLVDRDDDEVARALLLRAELLGRTDRDRALADLVRARALSSTAARSVVDAAIPGRR